MPSSTKNCFHFALGLFATISLFGARAGAATAPTLVELPTEKVQAMEPMLRGGEIALIESNPDGRMKQISIVALASAPVSVVRSLLTTPEHWSEFVPNATKAK